MNKKVKEFNSLADLTSDPKNARKHTPRNVGTIVDALHEVGAARSIVIDENGVVLAGNATMDAAIEAGLSKVQVVDGDGETVIAVRRSGLTAKQKTRLALYDNRAAEFAEWDSDVLQTIDTDILEGLFSDKELNEILSQTGVEPKDAEPQIDKAEELRQKWSTETGQLWVIGNHRLLVGDAANKADVGRLCANERPFVLTDPPYGMRVVKDAMVGADFGIAKKGKYPEVVGDTDIDTAERFFAASQELGFKEFIIWGGNYFIKFLPFSTGWIIWDKRGDSGIKNTFADGEMAWTNTQRQVRIYTQLWNGMIREGESGLRLAPTQKPVKLIQEIIEDFCDDSIYDPFVGSGTTLVAAENLNRKCYAMEISPAYVAVCLERMSTAFPHLKIERVDKAVAA